MRNGREGERNDRPAHTPFGNHVRLIRAGVRFARRTSRPCCRALRTRVERLARRTRAWRLWTLRARTEQTRAHTVLRRIATWLEANETHLLFRRHECNLGAQEAPFVLPVRRIRSNVDRTLHTQVTLASRHGEAIPARLASGRPVEREDPEAAHHRRSQASRRRASRDRA